MTMYLDMAGLGKLLGRSRQYVRWLIKEKKVAHCVSDEWKRPKILFNPQQIAEIRKKYTKPEEEQL